MHNYLTTILWIAGGYGFILLFVYLMQSHLLYFPTKDKLSTPSYVGLDYETVKLRTEDDLVLDGWFVPHPNRRGVVLFFHGNAGNISHRLETLAIFHRLGLSTLIFDYRGYGESEGEINEQGSYKDASAAWYYLTRVRNISPSKIIFIGRSLGGAIASQLATVHPPEALIIESGFTSVPDLAAKVYPLLPVRWLSRFQYNSEDNLKRLNCPILIIHSLDDEIIPFEHGQQLYSVANEPKKFLKIQGGHNDGFMTSGNVYLRGVDEFLNEFLNYP